MQMIRSVIELIWVGIEIMHSLKNGQYINVIRNKLRYFKTSYSHQNVIKTMKIHKMSIEFSIKINPNLRH
jgi:hypothetical protein